MTDHVAVPPRVSGAKPDIGHMEEFSKNFARFLMLVMFLIASGALSASLALSSGITPEFAIGALDVDAD